MSTNLEEIAVLLKQVAKHDKNAFAQLYKQQVKRVRHFIYRKGITTEDLLDELCQDIFLKIWNKASNFDPQKGSANTWIAVLSQNLINDYWRKIQRTPLGDSFEDKPELESQALGHGDTKPYDQDTWIVLEKALEKLSGKERSLFSMVYIKGLTLKQCSEELGVPNGTIKWRINQIQKILKSEVNK